MKSSRKRSAASSFGGSEELPASSGGSAEPENNSYDAENTDNDAQPTAKLISKIQAVELLTTLIKFVPSKFSEDSAVAENNGVEAAKNAEIGDLKILSRFKLRYLCRRFRNIIHCELPLSLYLKSSRDADATPDLYIVDRSGIRISRHNRPDDQFARLVSSSLKTLPECVGRVDAYFNYGNTATGRPRPSISATLSRYSQAITQPCALSLVLIGGTASATKCFVKDFGIPFERLFPNVTLDKLRCLSPAFATDHLVAERDCLTYFLKFSSQSLVKLDVDLSILSSAFAPGGVGQLNLDGNPSNVGVASLPADWTCNSLRNLKLRVHTYIDYDYRDAKLRAAAHAEFAQLRRLFPNIIKLSFSAVRPQIDFAVLNEFANLRKFTLTSWATTDELRADSNLVPLANIDSFRLESTDVFPLNFSVILPNVQEFKLVPQYAGAFAALANEVATVGNTFQLLKTFVVKRSRLDFSENAPPFLDLILLIRSLVNLPLLNRLKIDRLDRITSERADRLTDWSPPGDLSLVEMLPKKLTHVSLICELLPPGATRYADRNPRWSLCSPPGVVRTGESVYKNWLRLLLFLIVEHPSLEHFFCLCIAPQFEAIFALAVKWNRSSVAAIADLGLASVVQIQCTPVYTRMLETRNSIRGDRYKFRFVLSQPAELAGAAGSSTKRKFVTVEFHNPN